MVSMSLEKLTPRVLMDLSVLKDLQKAAICLRKFASTHELTKLQNCLQKLILQLFQLLNSLLNIVMMVQNFSAQLQTQNVTTTPLFSVTEMRTVLLTKLNQNQSLKIQSKKQQSKQLQQRKQQSHWLRSQNKKKSNHNSQRLKKLKWLNKVKRVKLMNLSQRRKSSQMNQLLLSIILPIELLHVWMAQSSNVKQTQLNAWITQSFSAHQLNQSFHHQRRSHLCYHHQLLSLLKRQSLMKKISKKSFLSIHQKKKNLLNLLLPYRLLKMLLRLKLKRFRKSLSLFQKYSSLSQK